MISLRFIHVQFLALLAACCMASCSATRHARKENLPAALADSIFRQAHVGYALYDPAAGKMLERYQSDKYFIPASNVKIITCYAAMKTLGERLRGIEWVDLDTALLLIPTGDPSLLHPDFPTHPVADFIRSARKPVYLTNMGWKSESWGSGWSWDDYSAYYMAERSPLPVYGNVIRWYQTSSRKEIPAYPGDTIDVFVYSEPEVDWPVDFAPANASGVFEVDRTRDHNRFMIRQGREAEASRDVPFITEGLSTAIQLLRDSLHVSIQVMDSSIARELVAGRRREVLLTQPVDSLLRPMMHRSDNFYAEQTLLMTARQRNGVMDERDAISGFLATDLAGVPQVPRWADGSGLSRYNLFTPEDFVWVLRKMQQEFGMDRVKGIFPSSGYGTLSTFLKDHPGKLYAKTGTLSGVIALSGFVQAGSGRWLIFSLLVNNHRKPTPLIRRQMEMLLREIMRRY
jgi:D-alanyl-D-alanine carboxypeptidase/D-alanyl-D-alanine-endopeptidase (penicillin-binding protein 4)